MIRLPPLAFRLRRRFRRLGVAQLLLPGCIALVGGVLVVMALDSRGPEPVPALGVRKDAPETDAASTKVVARTETAVAAQALGRPGTDLSALPGFEIPPPLRAIDGVSFWRNDDAVRLDGVEGPGADAVCFDDVRHRWACGLQARAALHNLVAGRAISCRPRLALAMGEMTAECRLDGGGNLANGDIARLLVAAGWARPNPASADRFRAEAEQAKARSLGMWRGGWALAP